MYLYFRAELFLVDKFLEKDDLAHDGLILTDGGVSGCAALNTPENDLAETMYNRQQILEINYPSQLATLVNEEKALEAACGGLA